MPSPNKPSSEGGFNVDDLVKRIDAKIAELEEEERREKELQEQQQTESFIKEDNEFVFNDNKINEIPVESNIKDETQTYEEQKNNNNGITDDQFFDDFFSDE